MKRLLAPSCSAPKYFAHKLLLSTSLYSSKMHTSKLAILLVAAVVTPTAFSCRYPDNLCNPPGSISCYASTSLLASLKKTGHHSSPAANPGLRHGDMRGLGKVEATVIDYEAGSWELARDEVVNAVEEAIVGAETAFQLNVMMGDTLRVLLIQEDGMTISTEDFDSEFTLVNAFIEKSPDVEYQVDCPASDDGDKCAVKRVNQQGEDDNDLVACFTEDSIITKEDIAAECDDEMYDMALYTLPGPHFILAGTKSLDLDPSYSNTICPKSIAFSTQKGKQIVSPYMEDINDLPKHNLGVATLADVLSAEENADAIDETSYDLLTNNCVNYASRIWRRLEFDETEDLANFLVHNIIVDKAQLEKLASKHGGRRLLKTMFNKGLEKFWENVVYSQLYLN